MAPPNLPSGNDSRVLALGRGSPCCHMPKDKEEGVPIGFDHVPWDEATVTCLPDGGNVTGQSCTNRSMAAPNLSSGNNSWVQATTMAWLLDMGLLGYEWINARRTARSFIPIVYGDRLGGASSV